MGSGQSIFTSTVLDDIPYTRIIGSLGSRSAISTGITVHDFGQDVIVMILLFFVFAMEFIPFGSSPPSWILKQVRKDHSENTVYSVPLKAVRYIGNVLYGGVGVALFFYWRQGLGPDGVTNNGLWISTVVLVGVAWLFAKLRMAVWSLGLYRADKPRVRAWEFFSGASMVFGVAAGILAAVTTTASSHEAEEIVLSVLSFLYALWLIYEHAYLRHVDKFLTAQKSQ